MVGVIHDAGLRPSGNAGMKSIGLPDLVQLGLEKQKRPGDKLRRNGDFYCRSGPRATTTRELEIQVREEMQKKQKRADFGIGWSPDFIPDNARAAARLGGSLPSSLCCIVLDEETHSLKLASTNFAFAAVNLEYLSLALRVRRSCGSEPFFSLDPASPMQHNAEGAMQVKRFEPAWLAGTSVGEVMFQADVYLKELSMGEHSQPVVGMRSALDHASEQDSRQWLAREWFVLRNAEVNISEDGVLVPEVEMGVDAREMVVSDTNRMEDVPVTRPDHPLVKYAESFSQNFDLIAERKSVIHHLRELARATVLAKFICDAEVNVDESWFNLAGDRQEGGPTTIPQLWSERHSTVLQLRDGQLVDLSPAVGCHTLRVYGGVNLATLQRLPVRAPPRQAEALGRFPQIQVIAHPILQDTLPPELDSASLSKRLELPTALTEAFAPRAPVAPRGAVTVTGAVPGQPRLQRQLVARGRLNVSTIAAPSIPQERQLVAAPVTLAALPMGVDMSLDEINLSAAQEKSKEHGAGSMLLGEAFWRHLDAEVESRFHEEDQKTLKAVFPASMSDRKQEGEQFKPPEVTQEYIAWLRELVEREEAAKCRRRARFAAADFKARDPGAEFPMSWSHPFTLLQDKIPDRILYPRDRSSVPQELLATPCFENCTEDSTVFRIYMIGSDLEVRTIQELDAEESIHAVFSVVEQSQCSGYGRTYEHETVVKVTEYVEKSQEESVTYFVVFETEMANVVLTQRMPDGSLLWQENPDGLELRSSLGRVMRSSSCGHSDKSLGDVKKHAEGLTAFHAESRAFTKDVYGFLAKVPTRKGRA